VSNVIEVSVTFTTPEVFSKINFPKILLAPYSIIYCTGSFPAETKPASFEAYKHIPEIVIFPIFESVHSSDVKLAIPSHLKLSPS